MGHKVGCFWMFFRSESRKSPAGNWASGSICQEPSLSVSSGLSGLLSTVRPPTPAIELEGEKEAYSRLRITFTGRPQRRAEFMSVNQYCGLFSIGRSTVYAHMKRLKVQKISRSRAFLTNRFASGSQPNNEDLTGLPVAQLLGAGGSSIGSLSAGC